MAANLIVGFAAGVLVATVTAPVGVSGAAFTLPIQLSVLGVPNPAVTPTNLLYNVTVGPRALCRYGRGGLVGRPLIRLLLAGTIPGVIVGAIVRVFLVPGPEASRVIAGVVLLGIGGWLIRRTVSPPRVHSPLSPQIILVLALGPKVAAVGIVRSPGASSSGSVGDSPSTQRRGIEPVCPRSSGGALASATSSPTPSPACGCPVNRGYGTRCPPFTEEELEVAYLDWIGRNPRLADVLLILGWTGMRWSEARAVRVGDLMQVPTPGLMLRRAAPEGVGVKSTKGRRARRVPLANRVLPLVLELAADKQPGDLLLTSGTGGQLQRSSTLRSLDWGATSHGRRIHDLRHTTACLWLARGVDPGLVQAWMGCESIATPQPVPALPWNGSPSEWSRSTE